MSITLMAATWNLDIPSTEKMVLMCLADYANDEGENCWPAVATLARKCSKGDRTIQGAIKWLAQAGYLIAHERPGKSTAYHLNPRRICTPAESAPPQKPTRTPAESAPKPPRNTIKNKNAHELPENWEPKEFGPETKTRKAMDAWPPGEIEAQLEHFTAHHRARGNTFKNWDDAWSTWVLNGRKFDNAKSNSALRPNRGGSTASAAELAMQRLGYA